jgi:hypothetical protein
VGVMAMPLDICLLAHFVNQEDELQPGAILVIRSKV